MMSQRPTSQKLNDFWEICDYAGQLLKSPGQKWVVEGVDMTGTVVAKSEQQMEATAKELYSILGMEGDFVPQSQVGDWYLSEEESSESD